MVLVVDSVGSKKRQLNESYALLERLKKLRALNADPRLVGIDRRFQKMDTNFAFAKQR